VGSMRLGLFCLVCGEVLLIVGGEVEKLVLAHRAADRAAELLLREAGKACAIGEARGEAGHFWYSCSVPCVLLVPTCDQLRSRRSCEPECPLGAHYPHHLKLLESRRDSR